MNCADKSILQEMPYTIYGTISKVLRKRDRDMIHVRADGRDVIAADVAHLQIDEGCYVIEAAPGTARRHGFFTRLMGKKVAIWPRIIGPREWCHVSVKQGEFFGKPVIWRR